MRRFVVLAFLVTLSAVPASAQHIAVGARAGSLGPGLELSARVSPFLNLRGSAHYLRYDRADEFTSADVRLMAESELRMLSAGAMADILPFRQVFRLSLGFLWNDNGATSRMTPLEGYTLEGKTFSPERIGSLEADLGHRSSIQPYFGIGLGNPVSGRFTVLADAGMLYTDAPTVHMSGSGMIAPTAAQAADIEAGLYSFRWYPVIAVGFAISF